MLYYEILDLFDLASVRKTHAMLIQKTQIQKVMLCHCGTKEFLEFIKLRKVSTTNLRQMYEK